MSMARTSHSYPIFVLFAAATLLTAGPSRASSITLDALATGSYYFAEHYPGAPEAGFHCDDVGCDAHSAYFAFDLGSISDPITSGVLELTLTGYDSVDISEHFTLYDVVTPVIGFPRSLLSPTDIPTVDADLREGAVYGGATVTASDVGALLQIALSDAAIADLTRAAGDLFAIGLNVDAPHSCAPLGSSRCREFIDFRSNSRIAAVDRLVLTTAPIPEPASAVLFSVGAMIAGAASRRRGN
jgi:hypothetical protein